MENLKKNSRDGDSARGANSDEGSGGNDNKKASRLGMTKGRWQFFILTIPFFVISFCFFLFLGNMARLWDYDTPAQAFAQMSFEQLVIGFKYKLSTLRGAITEAVIVGFLGTISWLMILGLIVRFFSKKASYIRCCFRAYCFLLFFICLNWVTLFASIESEKSPSLPSVLFERPPSSPNFVSEKLPTPQRNNENEVVENKVDEEETIQNHNQLLETIEKPKVRPIAPPVEVKKKENKVENKVENPSQKSLSNEEFEAMLGKRFPGWDVIDKDREFMGWLINDKNSDGQRWGDVFRAAVDGKNVEEVAKVFEAFQKANPGSAKRYLKENKKEMIRLLRQELSKSIKMSKDPKYKMELVSVDVSDSLTLLISLKLVNMTSKDASKENVFDDDYRKLVGDYCHYLSKYFTSMDITILDKNGKKVVSINIDTTDC